MIATHEGKLPSILEGRSATKKLTDSVYKNNFFLKQRNSLNNSHEVDKGAASDRGGSNRRILNRTEFGAFGTALNTNRSNRSHLNDSGDAGKNFTRRSHSTVGQGVNGSL
jgi:hypothetical protein